MVREAVVLLGCMSGDSDGMDLVVWKAGQRAQSCDRLSVSTVGRVPGRRRKSLLIR